MLNITNILLIKENYIELYFTNNELFYIQWINKSITITR